MLIPDWLGNLLHSKTSLELNVGKQAPSDSQMRSCLRQQPALAIKGVNYLQSWEYEKKNVCFFLPKNKYRKRSSEESFFFFWSYILEATRKKSKWEILPLVDQLKLQFALPRLTITIIIEVCILVLRLIEDQKKVKIMARSYIWFFFKKMYIWILINWNRKKLGNLDRCCAEHWVILWNTISLTDCRTDNIQHKKQKRIIKTCAKFQLHLKISVHVT